MAQNPFADDITSDMMTGRHLAAERSAIFPQFGCEVVTSEEDSAGCVLLT
jgi:hypothetical protein